MLPYRLLGGYIVNWLELDPFAFPWLLGDWIYVSVQFLTGGPMKLCTNFEVLCIGFEYFERLKALEASRLK